MDELKVKDSNGTLLKDGDSVTLIKDLKVKGTSVTLKRGTLVRNIRLTGEPGGVPGVAVQRQTARGGRHLGDVDAGAGVADRTAAGAAADGLLRRGGVGHGGPPGVGRYQSDITLARGRPRAPRRRVRRRWGRTDRSR